jgi:ABC-type sugar transport system substrate-binding protein
MDTRSTPARRGMATALAVLALAFGAAACGGDDGGGGGGGSAGGGAEQKARTVYLNAYAKEIQYFRDWHEGATGRAKQLGWTVESEYGNTTPEQQVQQVQNAIVKKPDVMLITPMDEKSLEPVLREAKQAGIAVVTVGATLSDPNLVTSFVARRNYDLGVEKAKFVIDRLGGKGTVGIIHGIRGLTFSEDQKDGYRATLAKAPGIDVVDGPFAGGFSSDLGLDKTQNMLTSNPRLDAIIFDNDDLALGGIQAARERKISMDDILILGTDGGSAALDVVEAGDLDMTISLCGYREGIGAINVAKQFFDTGKAPKRVVSHVETFTPENIAEKRSGLKREDCA